MKILLFSTYFWPEETGPAPYVTEPVRFLASRGHEVEVWAGFPHYPRWKPMSQRALSRREQLDAIVVHRRLHYIPRIQNAATRALYEASLLVGASTALVQARRPHLVLGVTPTLSGAVAAVAAATRFRVPSALLVHDLVGQAASQGGVTGGRTVAKVVRSLELATARRASGIGVIADGFRRHLVAHDVPGERIVRLRTWTLGEGATESRADVRARLGWGDKFVLLHAGNMGHKQALENLINAAALLSDDKDIRTVLAGEGNDRPNLHRHAHSAGLKNLEFLGAQPWGRYESLLEAADLLVVSQRETVTDMSLPSKLTSYFAAGRPVLAAVNPQSETAEEVRRSGGGVVIRSGDPDAFAATVRELRDDPTRLDKLGRRAKDYADSLRPEKVLPEYEQFLVSLVKNDRARLG